MKGDLTLDTVGLYCPLPIFLTREKMKELKAGQILEVLSDDPDIIKDLPTWCKATGNRFLKFEEEDGIYRIYVQKVED